MTPSQKGKKIQLIRIWGWVNFLKKKQKKIKKKKINQEKREKEKKKEDNQAPISENQIPVISDAKPQTLLNSLIRFITLI